MRSNDLSETGILRLGGDPVVEFLNTCPVPMASLPEVFQTTDGLLSWFVAVGWLKSEEAARLSAQPAPRTLLADAIELREAMRVLFQSVVGGEGAAVEDVGRVQAAAEVVNRYLSDAATLASPAEKLVVAGPGRFERRAMPAAATWAGLLPPVAREAARVLAGEEARRLKRCENPQCILFFLDTSRNQHRRWCSMATCGNRHKVAAHYRRHRAAKEA